MRRDANLIRRIALATEALPPSQCLGDLPDVDADTFAAHVQWMIDARLIDGRVQQYLSNDPPAALVLRLTWEGCDFADACRSDTLWAKAQKSVIGPTMSWTFDILKDWLKAEIKQGFPTLRSLSN
ncbi:MULTISPECIES: DUF2513 domain-containing protein [Ralstonia solanacearum species complex]|uniref:DUF2513 domain-containing protein n=1 Tax=Ralstonia solanacearum species complex TaxID=3116862 RepID=UPI0008F88AB8|nr:DUF2513 domain-containing protein [Ralstonia pseudosolanacearum]MCK4125463.1 DUF2513 domain-containing protein [Ralstonia pseudosolanacearum]MCK4164297.1 DUF2513 domain-containing protein [Ralstonia pseudosolanacearum]OIN72495.1 hypothetical protein BL248_15950 [Ralstonia solanacearum]